jgi:lipopolysaccharide transport system ATP-binding protein
VLVVSHNMSTVTQLCKTAMWLSGGQLKMTGDAEKVAAHYLLDGAERSGEAMLAAEKQDARLQFVRVRLNNKSGSVTSGFDVREPIFIEVEYEAHEIVTGVELSARVINSFGTAIFTTNRSTSVGSNVPLGKTCASLKIPGRLLMPGMYTLDLGAHVPQVNVLCHLQSVVTFQVEEMGSGMASYAGQGAGVILMDAGWRERRC